MPHATRSAFAVRSYEIDSYGHLNNGVFLAWFEQGRLDHLESLGFSYEILARREQWMVVGRTEVDFRRPLVLGQGVQVLSWVEGLGRRSVRYRQVMRLLEPAAAAMAPPVVARAADDDEALPLVAEAATVMVFSGRGGGSIPIPEDFREALAAADARAAGGVTP